MARPTRISSPGRDGGIMKETRYEKIGNYWYAISWNEAIRKWAYFKLPNQGG